MSYLKELYELSTNTKFFMLMQELLSLCYADFNTTEHYLSYLRSLNDRITRTKVNLTLEKRALLTLTMSLLSKFKPLI
jgi:lipopolysaccharide biosynthesis regulator YciM